MLFGKHINRYYWKCLPSILGGIAALFAVDYLQLLIPKFYNMVITGLNGDPIEYRGVETVFDLDFVILKICIPMILVVMGMVLGRFLWRIFLFGTGIRVECDLRDRMFDNCRRLSNNYYHKNKVGDLMALFTNDLETVQECFGMGIMMFFDAVLLGGLSIIEMAKKDPLLTLLALIPMALLMASGAVVSKYMMKKWDERQEAFSKLSDFSQESFSGIAVIKAFVKEGHELWEFKKLNKLNEEKNVAYAKMSTLFRILVTLFVESVICVILGYGGYLVHTGAFSVGDLFEFIGYFTAIVWPIMAVSELIDMISRGKASLKRISELLDEVPEISDREGVIDVTDIKGKIEFRDLTFKYETKDFNVLDGVSFTIEAGENVGIIGKTGSGKTSIVDLILRMYNVEDGKIFIDGYDINSISMRSLRDAAAYVPQDNFLFSDTIENNIGFAFDTSIDEEMVQKAAILSDVHDNIIEFKDQYKTVLGERGVTVSGGQKQRISIARALIKDAPILILDDSVSAVDVKTEKKILQNLREERAGKTTILIAHRVSTIKDMDKIIYIEEGRVVGVGDHDSLYKTCAEYRRSVDLQKLEDEEDGQNA